MQRVDLFSVLVLLFAAWLLAMSGDLYIRSRTADLLDRCGRVAAVLHENR